MTDATRQRATASIDRIRRDALDRLSRRPMSRSRLADALTRRWKNEPGVRDVIARLERAGLLDDRAFAAEAIRQELARAPAGAELLVQRLLGLGVDEELARDQAARTLEGSDPRADARTLAESRLRSIPARLPRPDRARRLGAVLARRGFDMDTIEEVVRALLGDPEG